MKFNTRSTKILLGIILSSCLGFIFHLTVSRDTPLAGDGDNFVTAKGLFAWDVYETEFVHVADTDSGPFFRHKGHRIMYGRLCAEISVCCVFGFGLLFVVLRSLQPTSNTPGEQGGDRKREDPF